MILSKAAHVHGSAGGASLGINQNGTLGTIIGGPVTAGSLRWWQVDYESARDGWSPEGELAQPYFPPPVAKGGWRALVGLNQAPSILQTATIRSQAGVDANKLKQAYAYSQSFGSAISVLVIRNGWIAGEWGSRSPYAAASVSKSLAGLAVAKLFDLSESGALGRRFGPEEKLAQYLPLWWDDLDSRKRQIKIKHLMQMTSAHVAHDNPNLANYRNLVLNQPMRTSPGAQWSYASLPVDLLSIAFQNAAKKSIRNFFNQYIAAPIGMAPVVWSSFDGYTMASSGVLVAPQDLARAGYLKMMLGRWDSGSGQRQIVSARNIGLLATWSSALQGAQFQATPGSPFPVASNSPSHYGHLWWTNRTGTALGSAVPRDAFYAHGFKESLLVVVPSLNLIVVRFGNLPLAKADFRQQFMARIMAAVIL